VDLVRRNTVTDNSDPNKQKQLMWPGQSSSNPSSRTKHLFPINTNQFIPSHADYEKTSNPHILTITNNNLIPPFLLADSINSSVPSLYDSWASQNQHPITIINPETENNKLQSLSNQAIIFSSQPVIKEPPKITQPNKKITHGPNIKHAGRTKTSINPTRLNLLDPKPTQARPDIKKPKITMTETDPFSNPNNHAANQGKEDMEVQREKKRRREEEKSTVNNGENEHFLTASPGSQDCRDQ
jgi:hypothetical protein